MHNLEIRTLSRSKTSGDGVALYATVRNEVYFLPYFLKHYRNLGIQEFCFLDDHSEDGTPEILAEQPDVTLLRANKRFGEMYGKLRFGIASRSVVPRRMYSGRWVLTADLDEFLVLPTGIPDLPALVNVLDQYGQTSARAIMIDYYPATLQDLEKSKPDLHPSVVAPNFDLPLQVDWPEGDPAPRRIDTSTGVRERMFNTLFRTVPEASQLREGYRFANHNKVPLIRWSESVEMLSAHRPNIPVNAFTQLIFKHYKFYPGVSRKIGDALRTGAYWNESVEYKLMDLSFQFLKNEDLRNLNGHRRHFTDDKQLSTEGFLYCRV